MSRAISEQSIQDSRYKTITSEERTRHPTTNKKKIDSPGRFLRSQERADGIGKGRQENVFKVRAQSLRQSLNMLEYRRMREIEHEKYRKASRTEQEIKRTKSLLTQAQLNRLKKDQISEDRSIKSAYIYELQEFKKAWSRHFQRSKERQKSSFARFQQEQERILDSARSKLVKKCQSLKNKSAELMALQRQAQYFKKKGDVQHLSLIKLEKRKLVQFYPTQKQKIKQQRQGLILQWTREEELLVNRRQAKKYQALLYRLKEQRKDQERVYLQQKSRLKQKFKNVMVQLKHQQRMVLNFATMRLDQVRL